MMEHGMKARENANMIDVLRQIEQEECQKIWYLIS